MSRSGTKLSLVNEASRWGGFSHAILAQAVHGENPRERGWMIPLVRYNPCRERQG